MACTYPSIHFSLDEDNLEITVGCLVCGVVGVLWCVVKLGTLSLSLSLSLALSPSFSLSLSLSISFSLFFFFFFFSCSFSCSCSFFFVLSSLLATKTLWKEPINQHGGQHRGI